MNWSTDIGKDCLNRPQFDDSTNKCSFIERFLENCKFVLDNFDLFVLSSNCGILRQSLPISVDQFIIEGRIRDKLFENSGNWRKESNLSTSSFLPSQTSISRRFVCIQKLLYLELSSSNIASDAVLTISNIEQFSNVSSLIGHNMIRELCQYLRSLEVEIIFTCDHITEKDLFYFASSGLFLVDRIPSDQLELLASKCSCDCYSDPSHIFNANFIEKESSNSIFGACRWIDTVAISGNSDPYIKVGGITSVNSRYPCQLLLRVGTALTCRIYKRIIRRCLKATIAAFRSPSDSSFSSIPLLVPGGGAAEMSWSLLWSRVATILSKSLIVSDKVDISQSSSCGVLAVFISDNLMRRIAKYDDLMLHSMISLCSVISKAYLGASL
jgi:chaperonin GroEL (HSP60 family)